MSAPNKMKDTGSNQSRNLKTDLEKMYLEENLISKGYCLADLRKLPKDEARRLMVEACTYASMKLAEVESRAHLTQEIHFQPH